MDGVFRPRTQVNMYFCSTAVRHHDYAMAHTDLCHYIRGNTEGDLRSTPFAIERNLIDPMRINSAWRDRFPKMGMNRIYVGDNYPLCSDLPANHFLKEGATYYLLGKSSRPELQEDPAEWHTNEDSSVHIALDKSSQLFSALCDPKDGQCRFPAKVVLDTSLGCSGIECEVDALRSVEVAEGVFYEYTRPPCCHQAFFNDAKVLVSRQGRNVVCGDPRTETASVACCGGEPVWDELVRHSIRSDYAVVRNSRCLTNLDSRRGET
jgi:hypothetical protein